MIAKLDPRLTVAALSTVLAFAPACSRPPGTAFGPKAVRSSAEEDPLQLAQDRLRAAQDTAGYRDALRNFDSTLQQAEDRSKLQLTGAERDLLHKRFHLDTAEMAELEAGFFKPLDAAYVEECFLFRDAARNLEQQDLPAVKQAEICLDWVARQVLLSERSEGLTPPLFVIEQGHGTAEERALVFLALLQQFQIPGCVLAWPETAPGIPRALLVGIAAPVPGAGKRDEILLFDPRLGRPVFVNGTEILTLAQLRKQPELFRPAGLVGSPQKGVGPTPELLLACPLTALAPRMRHLERLLEGHENVVLSVEPEKLLARLEKTAGEKVGIWNPPVKNTAECRSPTRMLRCFLPAEPDGGVDSGARKSQFEAELMHFPQVVSGLGGMRLLDPQTVNPKAQTRLLRLVEQLFRRYVREPRNLLLHGHYEKSAKRLEMIASAYEDLEFSPMPDREFAKEREDWRRRVQAVYLAEARKESNAKELVEAFWQQDQYLLTLLDAQEKPNPQKQKKTVLSVMVLTALRSSLGEEAHYLRAQGWHERAEASARRVKPAAEAARQRHAADKAREAWQNAAGLWRKCVERYSLDFARLPARLRFTTSSGRSGSWQQVIDDLHRSASAQMNLGRAWHNEGKHGEASSRLSKLDEDLKTLRQEGTLEKRVAAAAPTLLPDFGPLGGIAVLQETIALRMRESPPKQ